MSAVELGNIALALPAGALLLALAVDHQLGEPAARWHPVVWLGHYLGWAGQRLQRVAQQDPDLPDQRVFWLAALAWCCGAVFVTGMAWALQWGVLQLLQAPGSLPLALLAATVLLGLALKPLLAWAMLRHEVQAVEAALGQSLEAGRARLGWLVSRDVTQLSESQVRQSAIESLAENLNDSVVAPIFWCALLGLPGAALFRFANTADAMWGYPGVYRGRNWAWAGKWAARADDALAWLPARLTAVLLALPCRIALGRLRREARQTPSPNSGWPMAAMALALDLRLSKPQVYVLNASGREPGAGATQQAIAQATRAVWLLLPIALLLMLARAGLGS